MASYVILLTFTEEGRRNWLDLSGIDAAKQAVQAMGVQWKGWYMTMGQYDIVLILDAPDDDTMARLALTQGTTGLIKSETLRAFTEEEVRQLVASLPPPPTATSQ